MERGNLRMHVSTAGAIGPRLVTRQRETGAIAGKPSTERRSPRPRRIEGGSSSSAVAVTNVLATAAQNNLRPDLSGTATMPTALAAPERRRPPLAADQPT